MMSNDDYEYDEADFNAPPTKEQIEACKPDMEFLKNCGLPHAIEDAWMPQDLFDYLTCIKKLCDKMNLSFDLYYKNYYWEARTYNPKIGKGMTFPVETGMNKAPLFYKAIRELAIAINEAWGGK
jgi:hypothetical protein